MYQVSSEKAKITSFTELNAWKKAHELTINSTYVKSLPNQTPQMSAEVLFLLSMCLQARLLQRTNPLHLLWMDLSMARFCVSQVKVYEVTNEFPKIEQFGRTSQLQRDASSVGANISEGFSRSIKADKRHFYTMYYGSLFETQNFLILARDVKYLDNIIFKQLAGLTVETSKLINGLIKSLDNGKGVKA